MIGCDGQAELLCAPLRLASEDDDLDSKLAEAEDRLKPSHETEEDPMLVSLLDIEHYGLSNYEQAPNNCSE